ncbi:MAG: PD-(D/E)XK nuclease domain-containing protein [Gammaproteobacteria bacterium]
MFPARFNGVGDEKFTDQLTNYLFACTSSHDFQAETDYHSFTLGLLASITETHLLYSNKEYGSGRPDCVLIPKDPSKHQGIILEFKHFHLAKKRDKCDSDVLFIINMMIA